MTRFIVDSVSAREGALPNPAMSACTVAATRVS